jgi:hypothetical protein
MTRINWKIEERQYITIILKVHKFVKKRVLIKVNHFEKFLNFSNSIKKST